MEFDMYVKNINNIYPTVRFLEYVFMLIFCNQICPKHNNLA